MTLLQHELKRGRLSMLLWAIGLSFMLGICILIYPEMAGQMNDISSMFADMGSFTEAFGLDQLNFGEFKGYFGIECGNTLGIGGAILAALYGISAIGKEEKEHTTDFLLTHPISRKRIYREKLLAVFLQILIINLMVFAVTLSATLVIGESLPIGETIVLFLCFLLMEFEIAGITFGFSAFSKWKSVGIAIGLALLLYFMNLISNLSDKLVVLKYISPFSYTDSAQIYGEGHPEISYILTGCVITAIALTAGSIRWIRKDIA